MLTLWINHCVHKGQNASCIHPNGVSADKEQIRIKSIPVIEDGLSQQEPRGWMYTVGPPRAVPNHHSTPLNERRTYISPSWLKSSYPLKLVLRSPPMLDHSIYVILVSFIMQLLSSNALFSATIKMVTHTGMLQLSYLRFLLLQDSYSMTLSVGSAVKMKLK